VRPLFNINNQIRFPFELETFSLSI